jgi:hypothetical protein
MASTTAIAPRYHPLIAAAAISLVIIAIIGTVAITKKFPKYQSTKALSPVSTHAPSATEPLPPLKLVEQST